MRSALIRILFSLAMLMLLAGCGNGDGNNNNLTSTNQMGGAKQGYALRLNETLSTFAGRPKWGTLLDGIGSAAWFYRPQGITTDGTNLYVVDTNNQSIRKVVIATGAVTTLAGSERVSGSADGTGSAAGFYNPSGITTDGVSLYVTDSFNNTIRRVVIATGAVTTLAGSAGTVGMLGSADGIGSAAQFFNPSGITTDGTNLYVVDSGNYTIRKVVIATGAVTTLAGSARVAGTTDGIGTAARFSSSDGITTDGANLYVTDLFNSTIRKVEIATGAVTTLAGSAGMYGNTDGTGSSARFRSPRGITTDGTSLYVADSNTIRRVVIASGAVTTLAGSQSTDLFTSTFGITSYGANLYTSDSNTIRKVVIATGAVTTLAGTNSGSTGSADGIGTAARFDYPNGITTDGANLYVTDMKNFSIRKVVIATGAVTTLEPNPVILTSPPIGITTDGIKLYVTISANNTINTIE